MMLAASPTATSARLPTEPCPPFPRTRVVRSARIPRGSSTPGSTWCRPGTPSPRAAGPPQSRARPGPPGRPHLARSRGVTDFAGVGSRSSSRRAGPAVLSRGHAPRAARPKMPPPRCPAPSSLRVAAGTIPGVGHDPGHWVGPGRDGDVHARRRDQLHLGGRPGPHRCRGSLIRPGPGVPTVRPGGEWAPPEQRIGSIRSPGPSPREGALRIGRRRRRNFRGRLDISSPNVASSGRPHRSVQRTPAALSVISPATPAGARWAAHQARARITAVPGARRAA